MTTNLIEHRLALYDTLEAKRIPLNTNNPHVLVSVAAKMTRRLGRKFFVVDLRTGELFDTVVTDADNATLNLNTKENNNGSRN